VGYADPDRAGYHRANRYFYSSARWRRVRTWYLRRNPICIGHPRGECFAPATTVDHIKPIADGGAALDADNLQSFCASCHGRKTRDDLARRKGGVKTCETERRLPTVQVKNSGRKFSAKGVSFSANSMSTASDALQSAQKRRSGRVAVSEKGCKGGGAPGERGLCHE
jgi:hypothetical protein